MSEKPDYDKIMREAEELFQADLEQKRAVAEHARTAAAVNRSHPAERADDIGRSEKRWQEQERVWGRLVESNDRIAAALERIAAAAEKA